MSLAVIGRDEAMFCNIVIIIIPLKDATANHLLAVQSGNCVRQCIIMADSRGERCVLRESPAKRSNASRCLSENDDRTSG